MRISRMLPWIPGLFVSCALIANTAQSLVDDAAIEARLLRLSEELRCLVCQNEALSESRAPLAQDLRKEIRQHMQQGLTDQQVLQYLTSRYGDFVLYRPPFKPLTYVLWLGPLLFLIAGAVTWFLALRRGQRQPQPEIDHVMLVQAARLLDEPESNHGDSMHARHPRP